MKRIIYSIGNIKGGVVILNNNIKSIRERLGIRQDDLAKILNISASTLSNKEAGRRHFTVEEVLKLEKILNVSVSEMFKENK